MTDELVRLTDDNPLASLRRADGTWSAREVQASGHVHTEWLNWNNAIKRGFDRVTFLYGGDVSAAQEHFDSTIKSSPQPNGGVRKVKDYRLTALGLFASCQQSQLPELDLWFVFAGLQAAGYGPPAAPAPAAEAPEAAIGMLGMTPGQLAGFARAVEPLDPAVQYLLAYLATQRPPAPTIDQQRAVADMMTAQYVAPVLAQATRAAQRAEAATAMAVSAARDLWLERHGVPGALPAPDPDPDPDPDPGTYPFG